jgi:hypothetical protein
MNELMRKYLANAQDKGQLITIRTDHENADKCSLGHLLSFNDKTVSIKSYNANGQIDGVFTINTTDLYGIDLDDQYARKLEARIKNQETIYADSPLPSFFSDGDVNLQKLLEKAIESNQLIHVNFYRDIGLYGYIKEMNETEFVIEVYDSYGRPDGISVFLIDDIKNINWDDEVTRMVELLTKK